MNKEKWLIIIQLFVVFSVMLCTSAFGLAVCRNGTHRWINGVYTSAGSSGHYSEKCVDCKRVVGSVSSHSMSWTTTKYATCTTKGSKTGKCSSCGYTTTSEITYNYNDHGDWGSTKYVKTAATCTTNGTGAIKCNGCGRDLKNSQYTIAKLGHNWGNYTITKYPTCTETGNKRRKCSRCGATQNVTIDANGHSFGSYRVITSPTCTATGVNRHSCTVCGYSEDVSTSALGHSLTLNCPDGNCNKSGVRCSRCGYIQNHTGYIHLSTSSAEVKQGNDSYSFSITLNHGGTLSASSTRGSASVSGSKVIVSGLSSLSMNTTITVTVSCANAAISGYSATHTSASATVSIKIVDSQPPTVSLSKIYVTKGTAVTITMEDNVGVTGYYVGKNSSTPALSAFTSITSGTTKTQSYTPTEIATYYVFARDAIGNISSPASFQSGIPATVSGPESIIVKDGSSVTFTVRPTGSSPFNYQWYKNTSNSNSGGTAISGATSSSYTFTANKSQNDTYYYCVVTNYFGNAASATAKLTVYYKPELNAITVVKNGTNNTVTSSSTKYVAGIDDTISLTTSVKVDGNPKNYQYQWYCATSLTGTGSKIAGANAATYTPPHNVNSTYYYYCTVSNYDDSKAILYSVSNSTWAYVQINITVPEISMGTIDSSYYKEGKVYLNKEGKVEVPFTVKDTGKDFITNSFTGADINVYVAGAKNTDAKKTITFKSQVEDMYYYTLTLTNVTGNGKVSFEIPKGGATGNVKDSATDNSNKSKEVSFTTDIIADNTAPTVSQSSTASVAGANEGYINKDGTLEVPIHIKDNYLLDKTSILTNKIDVLVDDSKVPATVTYSLIEEGDNRSSSADVDSITERYWEYKIIIKNITGNGNLKLRFNDTAFVDLANNGNASTTFEIKFDKDHQIIIDNTPPVIDTFKATLGGYYTSRIYPDSLDAIHQNWANESIFITINASDAVGVIDHYYSSLNGATFKKLEEGKETITDSINGNAYYKVVDKAGNTSEIKSINLKIDKIIPAATTVVAHELREKGAIYNSSTANPTASNKTIWLVPENIQDKGSVQSGILYDTNYSYYVYTRYKDLAKSEVLEEGTTKHSQKNGDSTFISKLEEDGYYEIKSITCDIAGNSVESGYTYVYISKYSYNTIKLTDLNDIGSGIASIEISVYKGASNTEERVEHEIINSPYKNYTTSVKLGKGTFLVEVILTDKVGLTTKLTKLITNTF